MTLDNVQVHLVDDVETAFECKRWLSTLDRVAIDTEAGGLNKDQDKARTIQLGDARTAYVIPIEWDGWGGLAIELLSRFTGEYVAHNVTYDDAMVYNALGLRLPRARTHDTRFQAHVLESTGSLALKKLATKHVDPRAAMLQDDLTDVFQRGGWTWATIPWNMEQYWLYAGLDTILTYQLDEYQRPRVMAEAPASYELELAVAWVCEAMERRGVRVDREYTESLSLELEEYVERAEAWCRTEYGVYPGSNQAVAERLRRDGVEFTRYTEKGAISLDKEVLGELEHPLAQVVLGRRQAQKMNSTYLANYLAMSARDGRLHPSINTIGGTDKNPYEPGGGGKGVRTGRMSSSNPNIQNVPVRGRASTRIRRCFVPDEGHVWIKADFSQIEMRAMAHMSQDALMIEAFRSPGDFFVNLGRDIFDDPNFQKSDSRRQLIKNGCVPLDTEILTRRGWLKHDEVVVGDLTIGLDPSTGRSRWTQITAVHHYTNAPVVRLANAHRGFVTTPNHRWLARRERSDDLVWTTTEQHVRTGRRLLLAAPADVGTSTITDVEARVLGWVLTDGSIERGTFVGATSQGREGDKVKCRVSIGQSKVDNIKLIDELMNDVPHRRYVHRRGSVEWRLDPAWARSLLDRVDVHDKHRYDAWELAFRLTCRQRELMFDAMWLANRGSTGLPDGAQTELTIALIYLNGGYARVHERDPQPGGWQRQRCATVLPQQARLTGQRTTLTELEPRDVWCVTTELGTWTMRQDRTPVLTGNSYAKIYGAGIPKFAATANVVEDVARDFMRRFDGMYPGVPTWVRQVQRDALQRLHDEGEAYVRSPLTNRKHVADAGKEYTLVNFCLQGMAAEIMKMKIVELDQAGVGDYLLFPVHDEQDASVPRDEVDDVLHVFNKVMNDDQLLRVPITTSVDVGSHWGASE